MKAVGERYSILLRAKEYFLKCSMIFFLQISIIVIIGTAALLNQDGLSFEKPDYSIIILRLLGCYLFHACNFKDVTDSLDAVG